MRTTITLDDETAAAVEDLMRRRHVGRSEAVNHLIRQALAAPRTAATYEPITVDLGLRVDVSNVADTLDLMDEWDRNELGDGRADRAG